MAFKAASSKEGFNAICHMDADTIRFALMLREGPKKEDDDFMAHLSEEERKILEEEAKRKKAESRVKPCIIMACRQTEIDCSLALIERVNTIKQMEKLNAKLQENLEEYEALSAQSNANTIEADTLQQTLQVLQHKEKKELKEKLVSGNKMKSSLEAQIQQAETELAELQNAGSDKPSSGGMSGFGSGGSSSKRHRSNLPFLNFALPASDFQRKHTGIYNTTATGNKLWSCCMGDEEDQQGCADDHSVGIKETFVFKNREAYRPYTVSQSMWRAEHEQKLSSLHRPASLPANGNKGFRTYDPLRGGPESLLSFFDRSEVGGGPFSPVKTRSSPTELLGSPNSSHNHSHNHNHAHNHSHGHSPNSNRQSHSAPSNSIPPPSSPIIKQTRGGSGSGGGTGARPSTVGSGTRENKAFSPSVSWAPMPSLTTNNAASPGSRGLTSPGAASPGSTSLPSSPLRPSTSSRAAATVAPIASILASPNRSIHTFGQGHKPPQVPCYVVQREVPVGWEGTHTTAIDGSGLVLSANKAHGMTTQPSFAASLKLARGTPEGYENNTLGLATLSYAAVPAAKNGKIRTVGEGLSIKRIGGRPLTAQWGPHLVMSSAVSPATSLEHTCARIV